MRLDLSSLASVDAFSKAWLAKGVPLHVLVNNGGMNDMGGFPRRESPDGHELHLATNFLGPAALTLWLLPALERVAASTGRPARVVSVASIGHFLGRVHRSDVDMAKEVKFEANKAYAQSKLMQVLFAWELPKRAGMPLLSVSLHPGAVNSNIYRDAPKKLNNMLESSGKKYGLSPREGSRASLVAATDASLDALAGPTDEPVYLTYTGKRQEPARKARDPKRAAWVWEWTQKAIADYRKQAAAAPAKRPADALEGSAGRSFISTAVVVPVEAVGAGGAAVAPRAVAPLAVPSEEQSRDAVPSRDQSWAD